MGESLDVRNARLHHDSVADTGDAYEQFHGWVLTCTWCRHPVRAATKSKALELMQGHYDDVDLRAGHGYTVIVRMFSSTV
jgi:hypothetical protein